MNKNKLLLIAAAGVAVWYFFVRKDATTGKTAAQSFAPLTNRPNTSNTQSPVRPQVVGGASAQKKQAAAVLGGAVNSGGNGSDVSGLVSGAFSWLKNGVSSIFGSNSDPASANNPHATNTGNVLGPSAPNANDPVAQNTGNVFGPTPGEVAQGSDANNQDTQNFDGADGNGGESTGFDGGGDAIRLPKRVLAPKKKHHK